MKVEKDFRDFIALLNRHNVHYLIIGGFAYSFYAEPRYTKDIDILIKREDLEKVRDSVKERGFRIDGGRLPFGVDGPHPREVHRISKVEDREILTLDLVIVTSVLQSVWDSREIFDWKGRHVQVVSSDGLAKMKRLAGRDQDLLDLKMLGFLDGEDKQES